MLSDVGLCPGRTASIFKHTEYSSASYWTLPSKIFLLTILNPLQQIESRKCKHIVA